MCGLGIVMARANDLLLGRSSPYLSVSYLLGVFVALLGLVVVAWSLKKGHRTMRHCSGCLALNPTDAKVCTRCRRPL